MARRKHQKYAHQRVLELQSSREKHKYKLQSFNEHYSTWEPESREAYFRKLEPHKADEKFNELSTENKIATFKAFREDKYWFLLSKLSKQTRNELVEILDINYKKRIKAYNSRSDNCKDKKPANDLRQLSFRLNHIHLKEFMGSLTEENQNLMVYALGNEKGSMVIRLHGLAHYYIIKSMEKNEAKEYVAKYLEGNLNRMAKEIGIVKYKEILNHIKTETPNKNWGENYGLQRP
jgi:Mg/Co/Ni transporter MgtE